jgi:hypothetical protein
VVQNLRVVRAGRPVEPLSEDDWALWPNAYPLTDSTLAEVCAAAKGIDAPGLVITGDGGGVTDAGLPSVAQLTDLEALTLSACDQLTDAGLASLAGMPKLCLLDMTWPSGATPAGVRALAGLPAVQYLSVTGDAFDDSCLAAVPEIGGLSRLRLMSRTVTTAGLKELGRCGQLHRLDLLNCHGLDGQAFAALQDLPNLTHLVVVYSGLGDAAVEQMARLKGLEQLVLCDMAITDASVAHLAGMPSLRRLELYDCEGMSPSGVEELRAAFVSRELKIGSADAEIEMLRAGPRRSRRSDSCLSAGPSGSGAWDTDVELSGGRACLRES